MSSPEHAQSGEIYALLEGRYLVIAEWMTITDDALKEIELAHAGAR